MYKIRATTRPDVSIIHSIYSESILSAEWLPAIAKTLVEFARASVGEVIHAAVAPNDEVKGLISIQTVDAV